MQTFLPYADFAKSAKCLDRQRLGKQRVEVLQLLKALHNEGRGGWRNHPAARMWANNIGSLVEYGQAICIEWISRGYKDTCYQKISAYKKLDITPPSWLGKQEFHASHRSNLLRKAPDWYSQWGWTETPDLPYTWP